jgi:hypothetical protein
MDAKEKARAKQKVKQMQRLKVNAKKLARRFKGRTMTVLNADEDGSSVTITTAHHYSGNITHPRQGYREMGVLIEYD